MTETQHPSPPVESPDLNPPAPEAPDDPNQPNEPLGPQEPAEPHTEPQKEELDAHRTSEP